MARKIEEMQLGADQLGMFHTKVAEFLMPGEKVANTEEQPIQPDEVIEVLVYGDKGTLVLGYLGDEGWDFEPLAVITDDQDDCFAPV